MSDISRPTDGQRVLVVAKDFPPTPGGVETYSAEVARAYAEEGFRVTVLTQRPDDPAAMDEGPAEPYVVHRVPRGSQLKVAAGLGRALVRLRGETTFDHVHATTWRVAMPSLLVMRRVPLVLSIHGREVIHYPRLAGRALRWTLNRASAIVAVSPATAELVTARGLIQDGQRVRVRWNGITWPELAGKPAARVRQGGTLRILSVARLVPRKNIDKSLLAIASLVERGIDVHYTVGGRGPELEKLRALAAEVLPDGVVTFAGYVPDADLPRLYASHDVFLHPHSHLESEDEFEGFGIVIADAMSFGCAVVVGRDGGPGDYVEDRRTGLLVDGDDPDSITDAVLALARDSDLATRVAASGRDYALKNFSWRAHVAGLVD